PFQAAPLNAPEALRFERKKPMESTLQNPAFVAAQTTPRVKTIVYWIGHRALLPADELRRLRATAPATGAETWRLAREDAPASAPGYDSFSTGYDCLSIGCGFMTARTAPVGSWSTPNRPTPGMSIAGTAIVPPTLAARVSLASGLSTTTYGNQC